MTLIDGHLVSVDVLPLNDATVDALCDVLGNTDYWLDLVAEDPEPRTERTEVFYQRMVAKRVAIQETLNELAPLSPAQRDALREGIDAAAGLGPVKGAGAS